MFDTTVDMVDTTINMVDAYFSSTPTIYICSIITSVMYCCAETTLNTIFWLILNLTGGSYPGRILGRFGVGPANVGPGSGLGLRPGRSPARPSFRPARLWRLDALKVTIETLKILKDHQESDYSRFISLSGGLFRGQSKKLLNPLTAVSRGSRYKFFVTLYGQPAIRIEHCMQKRAVSRRSG